jgi:hypothetical protein
MSKNQKMRVEILTRIAKLDEEELDKVCKFIEELEKEGCDEYGKQ